MVSLVGARAGYAIVVFGVYSILHSTEAVITLFYFVHLRSGTEARVDGKGRVFRSKEIELERRTTE